jgi:hypothetical protein
VPPGGVRRDGLARRRLPRLTGAGEGFERGRRELRAHGGGAQAARATATPPPSSRHGLAHAAASASRPLIYFGGNDNDNGRTNAFNEMCAVLTNENLVSLMKRSPSFHAYQC